MSARRSVVVVGSVNADVVVRVAALPSPGETVTGGRLGRFGGGKGANAGVAAVRSGAAVSFVGAVGDDDLGREALARLRDEGIDVSRVATLDGVATGVAAIQVDEAGENQIAVAPGANACVDAGLVAAALDGVDPHGVLLMNLEIPDDGLVAAAGRWAGPVLVNPAPARTLPDALLDAGPLLTPNAGEAARLSGHQDPDRGGRALYERTRAPVLVTLGGAGALLVDGDGRAERIAALAVETVDTTGAGDTLNGALAAGLARGERLCDAAAYAVVAASLSTTASGAREGMPRRDAVQARL